MREKRRDGKKKRMDGYTIVKFVKKNKRFGLRFRRNLGKRKLRKFRRLKETEEIEK